MEEAEEEVEDEDVMNEGEGNGGGEYSQVLSFTFMTRVKLGEELGALKLLAARLLTRSF